MQPHEGQPWRCIPCRHHLHNGKAGLKVFRRGSNLRMRCSVAFGRLNPALEAVVILPSNNNDSVDEAVEPHVGLPPDSDPGRQHETPKTKPEEPSQPASHKVRTSFL